MAAPPCLWVAASFVLDESLAAGSPSAEVEIGLPVEDGPAHEKLVLDVPFSWKTPPRYGVVALGLLE